MKKNIAKIFFYISLLPYALVILFSLYLAQDIGIMWTQLYGLEAFSFAFEFLFLIFSTRIPILPVCLIYQIIYFFILKKKLQTQ